MDTYKITSIFKENSISEIPSLLTAPTLCESPSALSQASLLLPLPCFEYSSERGPGKIQKTTSLYSEHGSQSSESKVQRLREAPCDPFSDLPTTFSFYPPFTLCWSSTCQAHACSGELALAVLWVWNMLTSVNCLAGTSTVARTSPSHRYPSYRIYTTAWFPPSPPMLPVSLTQ